MECSDTRTTYLRIAGAGSSLLGGGGVDGAIHRAAGPDLLDACRLLGGCNVGDAKATKGYRLPATWIIHAVGPRYQGGRSNEAELLVSAYRRCIEVADDLGAKTVAFPSISTGIYGYPAEEAAALAIDTLRRGSTSVERVDLMAFSEESAAILLAELTAKPGSA